jgi:porin
LSEGVLLVSQQEVTRTSLDCQIARLAGASTLVGVAAAEEPAGLGAFETSVSYTADIAGVVEGRLSQRGRLLDYLDLIVDVDLKKAIGWRGATAHADVLNNSGEASTDDVGSLFGSDQEAATAFTKKNGRCREP